MLVVHHKKHWIYAYAVETATAEATAEATAATAATKTTVATRMARMRTFPIAFYLLHHHLRRLLCRLHLYRRSKKTLYI